MLSAEVLLSNLISPVVLAFYLGVFATVFKSDLNFPASFFSGLASYLLLAIGIKGGASLSEMPFSDIIVPICTTVMLSIFIPYFSFLLCRHVGKLKSEDAAAMAAHYGSVSIVTFIACKVFIESLDVQTDSYMTGLLALMEVPGIIVALLLAKIFSDKKSLISINFASEIRKIFFSKSIYLLWGGLLMGVLSGSPGLKKVSGFFVDPFYGVLVLFMLEMGLLAGKRLNDLKEFGLFLISFSLGMPLLSGALGVFVAKAANFSLGNAVVFSAMTASASYIAAPAAVRSSLPNANPAYYLTCALGVTFPFNLTIGIPVYYIIAKWWYQL